MRDPRRIERIIRLIYMYWTKNPDLRLGQLIKNSMDFQDAPIYYIEDDLLEQRLKENYEK